MPLNSLGPVNMASREKSESKIAWKGDDGIWSIVKRLFSDAYRPEHRTTFILAIICMIIAAGATAVTALLMRNIINDIFVDQQAGKIALLGSVVMLVFATKGFANYGQTVSLQRIGNAVTRQFQVRMIEKLTSMSSSFFEDNHSSTMIMRIAQNATAMSELVILVATSVGSNLLTLTGLIIVMVIADPIMSFISLIILPAVIFGLRLILKSVRSLDTGEFSGLARVITSTQETVSGIKVIKAFSLEKKMQTGLEADAREVESRLNAISRRKAAVSPLMETLGGVSIGAVIFYSGWQTVANGKTPGEFMAFITAFLLAYEPAKRLAGFNVAVQRAANRARMVYDLLDDPNVESNKANATVLDSVVGDVALENVSFRYKDKKEVLNRVTFRAQPNTTTAIVGPSGAGKSTCFSLIQRLFHPSSGRITVDGHDIADVTFESLRANIALVTQDTYLFSGSIRDNIAQGNLQASDEDIERAAESALVNEFASALKGGLNSQVGEGAITLSGGQKQRIAIARAILKDAPILLLDEATSALDNESDRLVREALTKLKEGRTTIIIAHRLSTVIDCDAIYYLDNGKIVENGTHDSLMKAKGPYYKLFNSPDAEFPSAAQ
ncbi:MAG: ABC transporter ATP-binding protein [Pseudomonadota bacterium]